MLKLLVRDPASSANSFAKAVRLPVRHPRVPAVARLLLALICGAIFLCGLATPFFVARLID